MNTSFHVRALKPTASAPAMPAKQPLDNYRDRLLRLPDVIFLTGLGKTSIYNRCQKGEFPAPLDVGARAVAWRESEVLAWMDGLQRASTAALQGSAAK